MTAATVGTCCKCNRANELLVPLYGNKGGPLTCLTCGAEWHGKYNRRRKLGRIVTKAIKAYFAAGGNWKDIDRLKLSAAGVSLYAWETDTIGAEIGDITTELLDATIRLTHPDKHPAERQEAAHRVTQYLVALKPFTFPAPKEKPPEAPTPRNGSIEGPRAPTEKPLRAEYPCEICVDEVPYNYCKECTAEWDRRQQRGREIERKKRHKQYARRRQLQLYRRGATKCSVCGGEFKSKRKDARYCSAACRQRAHRNRVTDKALPKAGKLDSRHAVAAA